MVELSEFGWFIKKVLLILLPVLVVFSFFYLTWNNIFGLRNLLYLDTHIHDVLTIKQGEVIQRGTDGKTLLTLAGRVGILARQVDIAILSNNKKIIQPKEWVQLDKEPSGTYFQGDIFIPSGVNTIFLKSRNEALSQRTFNAFNVNIGEVFIVAGQSNASGSSNTLFVPQSEFVLTGQFQQDGSLIWKHGADPQILGGGGSVWPLVGDELYLKLGIPIGFINVAEGATSIMQWQPETFNFQQLVKAVRAIKPQGPRAILWHQGESDHWMSADDYFFYLSKLIKEVESQCQIKIPWLVSLASYQNDRISENVRHGQMKSWLMPNVLDGPDTDELGKAYRYDNVHFNEEGTRAAAALWVQKIDKAFFGHTQEKNLDSVYVKAF